MNLVDQPSYTPANNVSETMKNIRWLLNKHLKNIDFSHAGVEAKKGRDVTFKKPLPLEKVLEIKAKLDAGGKDKDIAKEMGLSFMAVFNIKHKRLRYKNLPDTEPDIRKWFEAKSKLKPGVRHN